MSWDPRMALGLALREGLESQNEQALIDALDERAALDGRHPAMTAIWINWADHGWTASPRWHFPGPDLLAALADRDITPVIYWQPVVEGNIAVPYDDIVAGQHDAYIRDFAQAAAGSRVIVRFAHEMNAKWMPWALGKVGNTTASARVVHRHLHDVIRAEAPEVSMFWCPNGVGAGMLASYADIYPGDAFVQYVGFDAYQWSGTGGASAADLYRPSIAALKAISDRPILIGETSVAASGDPDDIEFRRGWLRGLREVRETWPIVAGVIWFDIDKRPEHRDWRIRGVPNLVKPWRDLLADPDFGGTVG